MSIAKSKLFLCSGLQLDGRGVDHSDRQAVLLDSLGDAANVHIQLERVARSLGRNLDPRLIDLLEIASYVYTADSSTPRGVGFTEGDSKEKWGRDFHFVIPVRDVAFWNSDGISERLKRIIEFLSNDTATFEFRELVKDRPTSSYLDFGGFEDWDVFGIDRVTMFSGGLDSLAGTVEQCTHQKPVFLVSHSPVATTLSRQTKLVKKLRARFDTVSQHVSFVVNKDKSLGKEFLQRTRSFLFSAIGTIIAETIKAKGVRFYENGIVSLNLPVADEVLRARASRTTHPHVLKLFSEFYSLVTNREFIVDNPFIFKTKSEIIEVIKACNSADLIEHTCSCAHTGFFQSSSQWHCGTCSQCIDRRVAIVGAGAQEFDPETDYKEDVFTGRRKDGYEKNMAIGFARHAMELRKMGDYEIASRFSTELARATRHFENRTGAADEFIKMHKRHAEVVCTVIADQISLNSTKILSGELEKNSLIALVSNRAHLESSWVQMADKIFDLLQRGLPLACQSKLPETEPHLQEICDGILQAEEDLLIREFPFMRWSTGYTKADWSARSVSNLQLELKYVREKKDLAKIRKDVAEDITKYGDNEQRVLFLIYDPNGHVVNETDFGEPVNRREQMMIRTIKH